MSTIQTLVQLMQQAGNQKNTTGHQKKKWVIEKMKEVLNFSEEVEDLLADIIDVIIQVDGHQLVINPKIPGCLKSMKTFCLSL